MNALLLVRKKTEVVQEKIYGFVQEMFGLDDVEMAYAVRAVQSERFDERKSKEATI